MLNLLSRHNSWSHVCQTYSGFPVCTVVLFMQNVNFTHYFRGMKRRQKGSGSIFLRLFLLKTCYDIRSYLPTHKKRKELLHSYHSKGFVWNPCLCFIKTVLTLTSPFSFKWGVDWRVQLSRCLQVCVFDYLWQAYTGRTTVFFKKKPVVKWIVGQTVYKGEVTIQTRKPCAAEPVSNICYVKKKN